MKIFKGMGGMADAPLSSFQSVALALCADCQKAFKACFKKDDDGKIHLDYSHNPKLCEACRQKMKDQYRSSFRPS